MEKNHQYLTRTGAIINAHDSQIKSSQLKAQKTPPTNSANTTISLLANLLITSGYHCSKHLHLSVSDTKRLTVTYKTQTKAKKFTHKTSTSRYEFNEQAL